MIGLYVHVPFCLKKCYYCDFTTTLWGSGERVESYLDAIERESAHHAKALGKNVFDSVYVGGGTPSVLNAKEMTRLIEILKKHFHWKKNAEITLEVNPGDLDADKAALYHALGINRVSLGVQSFSEDTLRRLNRSHGPGDNIASYYLLRRAGITNINLDLMFSLPGESLGEFLHSVRCALELAPFHVSLYELVIEERTVFGRALSRGRLGLPTEEASLESLRAARELLLGAGLEQYELLNYAKPGFESRHNELYWRNESYLGLGPGAFSYLNGRRFCLTKDVGHYLTKIANGDYTPDEEETLNPLEREHESFLLALRRVRDGAPKNQFKKILPTLKAPLRQLIDEGLLTDKGGVLRLSERGIYLAESVFSALA